MIHISRNNHQEGPYPEEEVRRKIFSGELALTDLGWREGLSNWTSLSELLGIKGSPPLPASVSAPPPPPPPVRVDSTSARPSVPVSGRSILAIIVVPGLGLLGAFFDVYIGQAFLGWIDSLHSEVRSQHPI